MVAAAERGRVDVLELLVAHSADVNEPLTEGIVHHRDREATAQRACERPIEAARREGQDVVDGWLANMVLSSYGIVTMESFGES